MQATFELDNPADTSICVNFVFCSSNCAFKFSVANTNKDKPISLTMAAGLGQVLKGGTGRGQALSNSPIFD